jgi:hypothetical protein
MEPNIITHTDQWSTYYASDESTMITQALDFLNGEWWVFVNGCRESYKFDSRVQAEDYAKTVLAVHLTVTP